MKSKSLSNKFGELILGMRSEYKNGRNAMEYARSYFSKKGFKEASNDQFAITVAYDLQSGIYADYCEKHPDFDKTWGTQVTKEIEPFLPPNGTLLEVGVGEATTLSRVISTLENKPSRCIGFDISWSRIRIANKWLKKNSNKADLLVGDIFNIPLADNSVDIVYSSHSLEPNGGKEELLMQECLRVAKKGVVFIEPIYELASEEAQKSMRHHGYIRGLHSVASKMECSIEEYKLLDFSANPLNPSGVISILKRNNKDISEQSNSSDNLIRWQCPITKTPLIKSKEGFYSEEAGIAYPILKDIPLLTQDHAVIASLFN